MEENHSSKSVDSTEVLLSIAKLAEGNHVARTGDSACLSCRIGRCPDIGERLSVGKDDRRSGGTAVGGVES